MSRKRDAELAVRGGRLDFPLTPRTGPPSSAVDESLAYIFEGRKLLVRRLDEGSARLPSVKEVSDLHGQIRSDDEGWLPLGTWHSGEAARDAVTRRFEGLGESTDDWVLGDLRSLYGHLEEDLFWLAARAIQVVDWHENHRFCGRCGEPTQEHLSERAKICPQCNLSHFPRLAPAVIVLVERDDEVLLGRSPHFPAGMFSTLAGFVEPGETLEQTVRREIEEEVGVLVDQIRYFGSQPWPFPNSLMVGFRAAWRSGEIAIDGQEIAEAGWFRHDSLPRIPPRLSIARSLIEAFRSEWTEKGAG